MFGYRAKMARNVERWHEEGWISDNGLDAIRKDIGPSTSRFGLASALGILGAVLIGFALMSFVAANWQSMSKLARLMVIFAALWLSYGAAAVLYWRNLHAFAHAAILAGIAIFGAGIMAIAQIYHLDGNPPDAVFVWSLGALATGALLRSRPAGAAAMVLASLWSSWQTILSYELHWQFFVLWGGVSWLFYWLKWRPGFHLAMIALSLWIVFLRLGFDGLVSDWLVAPIGIAIAFTAAFAGPAIERYAPISKAIVGYGIAIGFTGLFTQQFFESAHGIYLMALAIVTLGLLICAIFWGWLNDNRAALWLGYIGFSVEILSLYFKTLGTLLGTSLFFFIAGLLVIGLSWAAFQLHKHQGLGEGEAAR